MSGSRLRRVRHFASIAGALAALGACGGPPDTDNEPVATTPEPAPVSPPEPTTDPNAIAEPTAASWRLQAGDVEYEGALSRHYLLDGDPMIHLINADAVNFAFAYEAGSSGEHALAHATFNAGRGPVCRQVGTEAQSSVQLEAAAPGWLKGTFSALLGCPDRSLMAVEGSFQVEQPGD